MAVTVKVNDVISMAGAKSGKSEKGEWCLVSVKSETNSDEIKVWVSNPQDVLGHDSMTVVSITDVSVKNRKYKAKDGSERWAKEVNLNVVGTPTGLAVNRATTPLTNTPPKMDMSGFMTPDPVDDLDLPFS